MNNQAHNVYVTALRIINGNQGAAADAFEEGFITAEQANRLKSLNTKDIIFVEGRLIIKAIEELVVWTGYLENRLAIIGGVISE